MHTLKKLVVSLELEQQLERQTLLSLWAVLPQSALILLQHQQQQIQPVKHNIQLLR